jgi:hypothetical protein
MRRIPVFCSVVAVAAAFTLSVPVSTAFAKSKGGTPVAAKLYEFGVKRNPKFVAAGKVTFTAKNIGTMKHELVVVRVDPGVPLPTKADGSVDEEAILEADKMGEVGNLKPKKSGKLTATLAPGDYVLFCNIVDTHMGGTTDGMTYVHYAKGMHATFTAG